MTTFLYSLKANAFCMNKLMLSTLPKSKSASSIFYAIDYEEYRVLENNKENNSSSNSRTFKKRTNFLLTISCIVSAKVMFLTNSIIDKGISNSTCSIIVSLRPTNEPNVAFPTRDGIQVSQLLNLILKTKTNLTRLSRLEGTQATL